MSVPLRQLSLRDDLAEHVLSSIALHQPSFASRMRLHSFGGRLQRAVNARAAWADVASVSNDLADFDRASNSDLLRLRSAVHAGVEHLVGVDWAAGRTVVAQIKGEANQQQTEAEKPDDIRRLADAFGSCVDYFSRRLRLADVDLNSHYTRSIMQLLHPQFVRRLRLTGNSFTADELQTLLNRYGARLESLALSGRLPALSTRPSGPIDLPRLAQLRLLHFVTNLDALLANLRMDWLRSIAFVCDAEAYSPAIARQIERSGAHLKRLEWGVCDVARDWPMLVQLAALERVRLHVRFAFGHVHLGVQAMLGWAGQLVRRMPRLRRLTIEVENETSESR